MAHATTDAFADMFKTMTENYADAMRQAAKFNEDTARFWTDTFTKNAEDFRTRTQKVMDEVTPFGKTNVERVQKTFEQQMNRSMDFFREQVKTLQPTAQGEVAERMMSAWRESFETARESMDTFAKANQDMFKTWNEFWTTFGNSAANGKHTGNNKPAAKLN